MDIFNVACLACSKWIKRVAYESPEEAKKQETKCPFGCEKPQIDIYP